MVSHGGTSLLGMAKDTVLVWGSILPNSDAKGTMLGCKPEQVQCFAAPKTSIDFGLTSGSGSWSHPCWDSPARRQGIAPSILRATLTGMFWELFKSGPMNLILEFSDEAGMLFSQH